MPAIASSRLAAVRSVPEAGARRPIGSIWTPSERGKNSYHEPYSARSRSTVTISGRDLVTRSRSGQVRKMAAICGILGRRQPVPRRQPAVAQLRRQRAQRRAGRGRPARARRLRDPPRGPLEQQRALGEHQLDVLASGYLDGRVVVPAGDRVAPRLHVEAPRALARSRSRPRPTGRCPARARACTPAGTSCDPGRAAPRAALMMPCPSRKIVALTWNVSPSTALAGRRPHSTAGSTSRIGIRPITLVTLPRAVDFTPERVPV